MSETVKLIVKIPKSDYKAICENKEDSIIAHDTCRRIAHGMPLDSNSGIAEIQAYFDGEAFGWDEGREALIEDLKAEFIKLYPKNYMGEPELGGIAGHFSLNNVLKILDNIGKRVSE